MRKQILIAALASLPFGTVTASAHAFLDHANPRVGNDVRTAPREVTLWFTQDLEPAFSTVAVTDAAGARVDSGKATVGPGDRKIMRIGLKALAPGTYKVSWRVLSVDTHTTEGTFSFRVGE
jgi:methionine-rich copper-binding protein CopC